MTIPLGHRTPRLNLGDAIHDGWLAYSRSPRAFGAFSLLVFLVQLLCQPLQHRIGTGNQLSPYILDWFLYTIGLFASVVGYVWGVVGMVCGAWEALAGGRPGLLRLMRWDWPSMARILKAILLVTLLLLGPMGAVLLLVGIPMVGLAWLVERQGPLPFTLIQLTSLTLGVLLLLLIGLLGVAVLYLSVNQKFLVQIAIFEGGGPMAVVSRGRRMIDPHWPLLLLLSVVEGLLLVLGVLACFVGLFVAWPVVVCITTAAYRQLLGENSLARLNPMAQTG